MNTRCLRCSRAISSCVGCRPGDAGEVAPVDVAPAPTAEAPDAVGPVSPEAAVHAAPIRAAAANATAMWNEVERIPAMAAAGYPIADRSAAERTGAAATLG